MKSPAGAGGVAFTFDDGYASDYSEAYAYMEPQGIKGTVYVISDSVGNANYMTALQLQELHAAGWTIGNHTKSHPDLTTLTQAQQEAQFNDCATALTGWGLEANARHAAYPMGKYDAATLAAMTAAGMLTGRGTVGGNVSIPPANLYELNAKPTATGILSTTPLDWIKDWITGAVELGEIVILILHNVGGAGGTDDITVANFRALIDWIVANGYRTYTMAEIYDLAV